MALYARGGPGWMLGFVALVPWLRTLDAQRSLRGVVLFAWAMAVAYEAAGFWWFGSAIANYTGMGTPAAFALLLVAAPALQPQILVFAVVRRAIAPERVVLRALAGAAAWVATERWVPRLLGDTFGYGLYPSPWLRQGADAVGVAGLTFFLLLANEGVAAAIARGRSGWRPLALAAAVPLLLAAYGAAALSAQPTGGEPLRVALVQSNIVDYERLRREKGAGAVVREVLDTHYAMTYDAVERRHAQAVLWSETVYPTTFGHPKSEAGAELDREILEIVNAAGVPFVFGTYDRDAAGEYNAAAFVAPGRGLLGFYRKARPFPLTEYVPGWLDGPALRRWLPWAGSWQPGTGARVFPLLLKDGREIPVLPLICLDDVDTGLAIEGARLGPQAIVTLSNDAWFTDAPLGAQLHLAAAAFRSIETRLPQLRVTSNGISALIDATGRVTASTRMGERTLVIAEVPLREPPRTLMVAWGDWVGIAATVFLVVLLLAGAWWRRRVGRAPEPAARDAVLPTHVAVLPPAARIVAGALRAFARIALLVMAAVLVFGDPALRTQALARIRDFTAFVLAPELAAWCVLRAFRARASVEDGMLLLARGTQRLQLALRDIAAIEPWRLPLPAPGASLRLASGAAWPWGIAVRDPSALARRLGAACPPSRLATYLDARAGVPHRRLQHPLAKFVLLPLVLAIPAFRLHQHIAYGNSFGELYTFGWKAYGLAFALWWASWAIGVVLAAAVLRAVIEAATIACVFVRPSAATTVRRALEATALALLYLGLPAWLLLRLLAP